MKSTSALVLLGLLSPALAAPKPESAKRAPAPNHGRAGEVRAAFQTAWKGYYKYAFPHDTLLPLTNEFYDDRNEWGLTPFDALSTAIIMNEADIVNQILDFVPSIDFTTSPKTDQSTSLFESTIRYLGGMLSSYDLLKGPYKRLPKDPKKVEALLKQAESLADTLSVAFTTPSGLPDGQVILTPTPHKQGNPTSGLAEMGTLILEWTRLSDLTGNPKYKALVDKAESYLIHPTGSPEAWPGLVGGDISTETGKFVNSNGGWSGGTDSFYEYLIKMYLYDPKEYEYYKERWVLAADNTMAHLASHPTTRPDLTFLNQYSGQTTYPVTGHLTSFAGGNFILAGLLLKEEKYTKFGLDLAESYFQTYNQTASGIGPEVFRWIDNANPQGAPPADQLDFYNKAGFWVDAADYVLRPETIESLYYAYRATGDKKWQDLAYQCFKAITKQCRGGSGFSGIHDVTKPDGGGQDNFQQSFFLAEALKYSYLINIDDQDVQVKTEGNKFVFNTEAHPIQIRHA